MKRKIVPLCVILVCTLGACNTDSGSDAVPSVVRNSLDARYPNASNINWESGPQSYEAEFGPDKAEVTVEIASSGKFLRQKTELSPDHLPAGLATKMRADYKGAEIDGSEKVEDDGLVYYQIELERKGAPDTELVLDAAGIAQPNLPPYWD